MRNHVVCQCRKILGAILLFAALMWIAPPDANAQSEGDAVLATNQEFYRAFRESDMPSMEKVWGTKEPISVIHPGWPELRGREAVLDSWHRILENPNSPRIHCTDEQIKFKDGKALVTCIEHIGGGMIKALNIFHREDGRWKMIFHGARGMNQTGT